MCTVLPVGCLDDEHAPVQMNNPQSDFITQLDGNDSILSETQSHISTQSSSNYSETIQVHISQNRRVINRNVENRKPIRKVIKRNNQVLHALSLPVVMNLNPRSIYNKTDDLKLIIEQYEADIVFLSESWERDNLTLKDIIDIDGFDIISTVKSRDFTGGNPALIINSKQTKEKGIF